MFIFKITSIYIYVRWDSGERIPWLTYPDISYPGGISLSFHHIKPGNRTQIIMLGGKCSHQPERTVNDGYQTGILYVCIHAYTHCIY